MAEGGIVLDTLQFIGDNLPDIFFDLVVISLYHLLHVIDSVVIHEVGDNGDFLITLLFLGYLSGIHHYLAMENLLLDALGEVVGDGTDKHALRQPGNLAGRYHAVHLGGDGGGLVIAVDGHALPFL